MPNAMTPQDRLEVMELMTRYQMAEDAGDAEAYARTFAPDGVAEWANGIRRGRDEIRRWMEDFVRGGVMGADPARMRHFLSMPYIYEGDSTRCKARTYLVIFTYDDEGEVVANSLWTYIDDIVKVDGEWLFERRYMRQDMRRRTAQPPAGGG